MLNKTEHEVFKKYTQQGFDVIHSGIPDFILLKDGKLEFVEVKYSLDNLNPNQLRSISLLKKHNIPVRIERVPEIRKSVLLEKWKKEVDIVEV